LLFSSLLLSSVSCFTIIYFFSLTTRHPPTSTLFPYTTLFRSCRQNQSYYSMWSYVKRLAQELKSKGYSPNGGAFSSTHSSGRMFHTLNETRLMAGQVLDVV